MAPDQWFQGRGPILSMSGGVRLEPARCGCLRRIRGEVFVSCSRRRGGRLRSACGRSGRGPRCTWCRRGAGRRRCCQPTRDTRRGWEAVTEPTRRIALAADAELRRRHPDAEIEPLRPHLCARRTGQRTRPRLLRQYVASRRGVCLTTSAKRVRAPGCRRSRSSRSTLVHQSTSLRQRPSILEPAGDIVRDVGRDSKENSRRRYDVRRCR
jgi:hypothetical protein